MWRPSARVAWVSFTAALLAVAVLLAVERPDLLIHHRPTRYGAGFHDAIAGADRIVVRDGGFDCCGPRQADPVLFVVTNPVDVQAVAANIAFAPGVTTNSFDESCMCCGGPGLDWYRGQSRVALTALQHGRQVRWAGFSTGRILFVPIGYGDAPLTQASATWLSRWLTSRSGRDFSLEGSQAPTIVVAMGGCSSTPSADGGTHLIIDDREGGSTILVDGEPWPHAPGIAGPIVPGDHVITRGDSEHQLAVSEGHVYRCEAESAPRTSLRRSTDRESSTLPSGADGRQANSEDVIPMGR